MESNITLTLSDLSSLPSDLQLRFMRNWFYERFEDPVHRTPYISREGGYIWIWGGPYDAREELETQFVGHVSEDLINQLSDELEGECLEWAPVESPDDYDDYFIEDVVEIENCYKEFKTAIDDIQSLLAINIPGRVINKMLSLLFVNTITALETYLSDKFIKRVMSNEEALRKCVKSSPKFQDEKVSIAEVLEIADSIEVKTRQYLADIVWHNLGRIKPMYKSVLDVDIGDIGKIMKGVTKRHDLVHRNGRNKDGEAVTVSTQDVKNMIKEVDEVVELIESQLNPAAHSFETIDQLDVDF